MYVKQMCGYAISQDMFCILTNRLLWSNDGLLFVTYNHYETFLEII